jgi:tetratricopeptide (TPR) repeat protein
MRHETTRRAGLATALALLLATPVLAQHREYYIRGKVLDTQQEPIPGVEISLRDRSSSRKYDLKTDKKGVFKFAGLPHGIYEVTFTKEGYSPKPTEWNFETPQDTMQRVEVPDVVLVSQAQIQEALRFQEAEARFKEAEAEFKEAAGKVREGDLDGAIVSLQGFLEKNPENPNALFLLGVSYARKKRCQEAVDTLTRATELSPEVPVAHFELGLCYRELGDLPKALEAYDAATQADPANADSAYNAGLILFETNRIDEALVRFEKALASKPEDPELLEMAGRCYIHQTKFDSAVEHLERARAASTDPDKIAFLEELISQTKALVQ